MAGKTKVVCRCGKVCRSMKEWNEHLKKKHPKWRAELEMDGTLDEDGRIFKGERPR